MSVWAGFPSIMDPKPVGGIAPNGFLLGGNDILSDGLGGAAFAFSARGNLFAQLNAPAAGLGAKTSGREKAAFVTLGKHCGRRADGCFTSEDRQPKAVIAGILIGQQSQHDARGFHGSFELLAFGAALEIEAAGSFSEL